MLRLRVQWSCAHCASSEANAAVATVDSVRVEEKTSIRRSPPSGVYLVFNNHDNNDTDGDTHTHTHCVYVCVTISHSFIISFTTICPTVSYRPMNTTTTTQTFTTVPVGDLSCL